MTEDYPTGPSIGAECLDGSSKTIACRVAFYSYTRLLLIGTAVRRWNSFLIPSRVVAPANVHDALVGHRARGFKPYSVVNPLRIA